MAKRFMKIETSVGCDDIELLLNEASGLVELSKVKPQEICLLAPNAGSAQAIRACIKNSYEALVDIAIWDPISLFIEILNAPEAIKMTMRKPRLITQAERSILAADLGAFDSRPWAVRGLRAYGMKINGLPEFTKVLPAQVDAEAFAKFEHDLDKILQHREAMLLDELAPFAQKFVENTAGIAWRGKYNSVLVASAQLLSKPAFETCLLLASDYMVVAGNPALDSGSVLPHATSSQFSTFNTRFSCGTYYMSDSNLPTPVKRFISAVGTNSGLVLSESGEEQSALEDALSQKDSALCVKWHGMDDEFAGLARYVQCLLKQDESLLPSEIFIAVPNSHWARNIKQALYMRNLESEAIIAEPLAVDPRNARNSDVLEAYTLLALACDQTDELAWRTWCAIGKPDCNAQAWLALENYAAAQNKTVVATLASLSGSEFEGAKELNQLYLDGMSKREIVSQLRGVSLQTKLMGDSDSFNTSALVHDVAENDKAFDVWTKAQLRAVDPSFASDITSVRIGTSKRLCGLQAKVVIVAGTIDGLVPEKAKSQEAGAKDLLIACEKASSKLVFSYIQRIEEERANALGIPVKRVRPEDGKRYATVKRSKLIDAALDAAPVTVSGEQLLSVL